ncbi:low temperature requirement protein A [Microvirga massiliensis]|uniref:low temperature requirement protein A n=1 Tax=Microvirga massiliensis TaxID=1033741 RepID=UPI00062B4D06|nr:low temperature requirement protein A [Microvirga massiliensis]
MTRSGDRANLLRSRKTGEHARVTFVELFFDLVFVFAVTQLSHFLLGDLTVPGVLRTVLLLMAVWWVWIFTSWVTNWIDPQRTRVRLLLLVLMLAGLLLSTSIPRAFEERGLLFACAYTFMQVGRSLFMVGALWRHSPANFRNFQRIASWLALSGVLWIAGGLAHGEARFAFWIIALAIEYMAPWLGFWTPGLGRSATVDWDVEGGHMAERCGLFIIIALGESILVTGATFAELAQTPVTVTAFIVAFVGSVAMWWLYFDTAAERGSEQISHSADPGRVARLAYTYVHLLIVAGIIVAAVSDELILAHPTDPAEPPAIVAILGGPALYLLGNMLFKRAIAARLPVSHLFGLIVLGLLALASLFMSRLALAAAAAAVLVGVAAWERISFRPIIS